MGLSSTNMQVCCASFGSNHTFKICLCCAGVGSSGLAQLLESIMGKRGRDIGNDPSLTMELVSKLTTSRITKSALAKVFETLHAQGMLDTLTSRRQITTRVLSAASVETPFGPVIQTLDLGHGTSVEFCHLAALLHYLCSISQTFADVCKHAALAKGDEPL